MDRTTIRDGYVQLGLVTNDFDQAMECLGLTHGISAFKQMRELTIGARGDLEMTADFALAFRNGTQFEIIRPISGDVDFYLDALAGRKGFALTLHHLGRYCPTSEDYAAARSGCAGWSCPVDHSIFNGAYSYYDARSAFGHYLEFYHFPADDHFEDVPIF